MPPLTPATGILISLVFLIVLATTMRFGFLYYYKAKNARRQQRLDETLRQTRAQWIEMFSSTTEDNGPRGQAMIDLAELIIADRTRANPQVFVYALDHSEWIDGFNPEQLFEVRPDSWLIMKRPDPAQLHDVWPQMIANTLTIVLYPDGVTPTPPDQFIREVNPANFNLAPSDTELALAHWVSRQPQNVAVLHFAYPSVYAITGPESTYPIDRFRTIKWQEKLPEA